MMRINFHINLFWLEEMTITTQGQMIVLIVIHDAIHADIHLYINTRIHTDWI